MNKVQAKPSNRRTTANKLGALLAGGIALAAWLVPVLALLLLAGPGNVLTEIAVFFSQMAVVTFGGAYAVLAYVGRPARCSTVLAWLKPRQAR